MAFNATFNNISAISWQPVLLMEETRGTRENHWLVASHWQTLSHKCCTWSRFELTTSVVIGTDCIGNCNSNYNPITATTASLSIFSILYIIHKQTFMIMFETTFHNLITKLLLLIISYLTKSHIWRIFALATRWSINRRLRVVRHAIAIVIPIGSIWRICIIVVIFYWMMSVFTTWKWVSFICKINEIFVIILSKL